MRDQTESAVRAYGGTTVHSDPPQDLRIHTDTPAPYKTDPDLRQPEIHALLDRYWRMNVAIMAVLLGIWALVGLGGSILFADSLNQIRLFGSGVPLGFWLAHQGSIFVFVLLVLAYCAFMNRLDKQHHRQLEEITKRGGSAS